MLQVRFDKFIPIRAIGGFPPSYLLNEMDGVISKCPNDCLHFTSQRTLLSPDPSDQREKLPFVCFFFINWFFILKFAYMLYNDISYQSFFAKEKEKKRN